MHFSQPVAAAQENVPESQIRRVDEEGHFIGAARQELEFLSRSTGDASWMAVDDR